MQLFNIECLGKPLRLEAKTSGEQRLYWNEQLVAVSDDNSSQQQHQFTLQQASADSALMTQTITITLKVHLTWQPFTCQYQLLQDDSVLSENTLTEQAITPTPTTKTAKGKMNISVITLASLAMKLLKSAKVIKVAFVGASVAAYSWLFSFQFALVLIACLVVHEYGHIRAMKYFGLKTKGIYLIPFLGGMAVSDDKISTRWQNVVISIMGPTFGLLMSIIALCCYWLTDNVFFAGIAAINALLNLFNMLPILPLDGGHILKSISFSMNSRLGLTGCVAATLLGVIISYQLGLTLFGFLLLIGGIEILFEWRHRHQNDLIPLDRYGQLFSTAWYIITVALLIAIISLLAGTGDNILGLPLQILQS